MDVIFLDWKSNLQSGYSSIRKKLTCQITGKKYIFQYGKLLENLSYDLPMLDNHWKIVLHQ